MIDGTEADRHAHSCITTNIANLDRFRDALESSCKLFKFLDGGQEWKAEPTGGMSIEYRTIAARDGALNVYHFSCSLAAIERAIALNQNASKRVDIEKIKQARQSFDRSFPQIGVVGDLIASAGCIFDSPDKIREHISKSYNRSLVTLGTNNLFTGFIYGSMFSVGDSTRSFSITMNRDSVGRLKHITELVKVACSFRVVAPQ